MFKLINIEGLRGINKLKIDDFRRVNLFVGKNNCGKSTILESIFLLTGATNPRLPFNINLFRGGFNLIDENAWRLLFYNLNVHQRIKLLGELRDPPQRRTLQVEPHIQSSISANATETRIDKELLDTEESYSATTSIIDGLVLEFSLFQNGKTKPESVTTKIIAKEAMSKKGREAVIDLDTPQDYRETLKGIFLNQRTMYSGGDVSTRFNNIQIKKQTKGIIKILKEIEPRLEDLTLSKDGVVYCDVGLEKLVPINVMGDGMFRLFAIITTIFDTQNGIVLIDEIENGFHHTSQEVLWGSILRAADEFNVQLFATTHSMECVKAFSSTASKFYKHDDIVRLFRIDKKGEKIEVVSYDNKILASALESDWEVR